MWGGGLALLSWDLDIGRGHIDIDIATYSKNQLRADSLKIVYCVQFTHTILGLIVKKKYEEFAKALWAVRHGSGRNPSPVDTGFGFYWQYFSLTDSLHRQDGLVEAMTDFSQTHRSYF